MGSCMAHLNCFPSKAAGVIFWFFIAVPFGSGCWFKAKMRDDVTQNRQRKGHAKLWIFREIAKWRHASRPTTTAVVTDSHIIFQRYDTSPTSKSHRRWPGNPNGRSKVRNLCLFTLARSKLMLWRRLTAADGDRYRSNSTFPTSNTSLAAAQRWPRSINVP